MPRRRVAQKREILPDPKLGSVMLSRFINVLMKNGKKSIAEKVVYGALDNLEARMLKESSDNSGSEGFDWSNKVQVFQKVVDKVRPNVEVRSRRIGGATYQIPVEVKTARGVALAMRWIIQASRSRHEKGMMLRLSHELHDIINEKGSAMKKREDSHKMAKANQAFAHIRWN